MATAKSSINALAHYVLGSFSTKQLKKYHREQRKLESLSIFGSDANWINQPPKDDILLFCYNAEEHLWAYEKKYDDLPTQVVPKPDPGAKVVTEANMKAPDKIIFDDIVRVENWAEHLSKQN